MKDKEKIKKYKISKNFVYCNLLTIFFAFLTTVFGCMSIGDYKSPELYVKLVLPIGVGVCVLFYAVYFYVDYILSKDLVLECSVTKGLVLTYSTIFLTIVFNCICVGYFSEYALPIAFVALTVTLLLKQRIGIMATIMTCLATVLICVPTFSLYQQNDKIVLFSLGIILNTLSGIIMIYLIRSGYNRFKLSLGAILIALSMTIMSFVTSMTVAEWTYSVGLKFALSCFIGNIIAISLFTLILPLYEYVFCIWTQFKLAEICSISNPLLMELKEKASGTFNHCLTVANLAENCAKAIGIDPFMARACAYYHDIGKIKNSEYFVENQEDGFNPHDDLIPEVSAQIIIAHAQEGYDILTKQRMPKEVIKTALEHHGDSTVMYFYTQAKKITEEDLPMDNYRYPGPRPTSKYSAIIMLCDVCEALTRAKAPDSVKELEEKVSEVIRAKLMDGQFNECELTIKDLEKIKSTICELVPAILHKRIDYNKAKEQR